jgi:hypothetical protein
LFRRIDRRRYASTSFRLGVIAAVVGIAFVTVGSGIPGGNPFGSPAFNIGLGLLLVGGGIIVWALKARD